MKQIILSLAILSSSLTFAQKKEISNAIKAIDAGDTNTTNTEISKAEAILGEKTYLLEPSVLEQYYYAKGLSLLKTGKTTQGAEVLAKIADLSTQKIYTGRDDQKNKVYFVGKAQADKFGAGLSLKEETYKPTLTSKLGQTINPQLQKTAAEAQKAYNTDKNYTAAADKFKESYYLLKAAGENNQNYLYFAGIAYAQSTEKEPAVAIFNDLINTGYSGIETNYTAVNKKTNEKENLRKESYDLYMKLKDASDYKDFKIEKTDSKREELFEIQSSLLLELKKNDEAIVIADKGLKEFPKNQKLSQFQSLAYYRAGKTEEFANSLRAIVASNPKDINAWYNLGVILSKDPSKVKEAEDAYLKALAIDPVNKNALINMVFLKMGDDTKTVETYNSLRKAKKIEEANKLMEDRRDRFAKAIPFAEKLYSVDPKDLDNVILLKSFYNTTQNTAKFNEFKAIEEALRK